MSPRAATGAPQITDAWARRRPGADRHPHRTCWHRPTRLSKVLAAGRPPAGRSPSEEDRAADQLSYVTARASATSWRCHASADDRYALLDSPVALAAWLLDHDTDSTTRHLPRLRRRRAGGQSHPRPHPRQHHAVLADGHRHLGGPSLLGEHTQASSTSRAPPSRSRGLPFPGELYQAPRSWAENSYPNVSYFNEVDKGGHFAAWEEPQLFSEEMRAAFRSVR